MALGDIVEISIGDDVAYGQICINGDFAAFEYLGDEALSPEEVSRLPVLFRVPIHDSYQASQNWKNIGNFELKPPCSAYAKYKNKPIGSNTVYVFDTKDGSRIETSENEVMEMEILSVWEPHHLESRIKDEIAGEENMYLETIKKTSGF